MVFDGAAPDETACRWVVELALDRSNIGQVAAGEMSALERQIRRKVRESGDVCTVVEVIDCTARRAA